MAKAVIQPFEEYQKCRIMFVQTVAELANRPKHIESLKSVKVMDLLEPLLSDPVTSIKQSAALAIGRLAKHSRDLARIVVDDNRKIIQQLLYQYDSHNVFYKQATCFVISSVARHSKELARKIAEYKSIEFLVSCLHEYDPSVKVAAVWALGYIAQHSEDLANQVIKQPKAIDYLICCLQEPETDIKRITIQTISHIAKHSSTLTEEMSGKNNLDYIIFYLKDKDINLKHKICVCLANMARNSNNVAKVISEHQLPTLMECIKNKELQVSVITLLNEVALKSNEFAININNSVSCRIICDFFKENQGSARLFALPYVATIISVKEEIAREYIKPEYDLLRIIEECLIKDAYNVNRNKTEKEKEVENEMKSLACKVIENLTKHDNQSGSLYDNNIADKIAELRIHQTLLQLYEVNTGDNFLKRSTKQALESIITKVRNLKNLDILLATFVELRRHDERAENSKLSQMKGKTTRMMQPDMQLETDKKGLEDILIKIIRKQQDLLNNDPSELNPTKRDYLKSGNLKLIFLLQKDYPGVKEVMPEFEQIFSPPFIQVYDDEYEIKAKKNFLEGMDK